MAGRILGMGDVVSLVEKAQQEVSEDDAKALEAKMAKGQLDMDDFLKQMKMMRRMGSMKSLMGMLPGVGSMIKDIDIDEKELDRTEAMIQSMTKAERKKPDIVTHKRKQRIASGSGTDSNQVGKLTKQFGMLSKMMKSMGGMGAGGKAALAQQLGGGMGAMGGMGGFAGFGKGGTKAKSSGVKKRKPKKRR